MARVVLHEQIPYIWHTDAITRVCDAMFIEKVPHMKRYRYVSIHTGIDGLNMNFSDPT
jgi:hypothetical protein